MNFREFNTQKTEELQKNEREENLRTRLEKALEKRGFEDDAEQQNYFGLYVRSDSVLIETKFWVIPDESVARFSRLFNEAVDFSGADKDYKVPLDASQKDAVEYFSDKDRAGLFNGKKSITLKDGALSVYQDYFAPNFRMTLKLDHATAQKLCEASPPLRPL